MFAECLSANFFLPNECSSLLNGTTPGIAVALILARNLITRRSKNASLDSDLEQQLKLQSSQNDEIRESVSAARDKVLTKVRFYADANQSSAEADPQLENLINLVRAYLLCSEKFDKLFFRDLFHLVITRYEGGFNTKLEIYELRDSNISYKMIFDENLSGVSKLIAMNDLSLTLTIDDVILIDIESKEGISDEILEQLNQNNPLVVFSRIS
jgi:hypothetical protein